MPKLTVGGKEIRGVIRAEVHIIHNSPKGPNPVPTMEWILTLRLQYEDVLPLWALAKQDKSRWKKCDLEIYHRDASVAHKWSLLNGYIHEYSEVEQPGATETTQYEGGFYINLVIRGQMLEGNDYDGKNVMTVTAGGAPANAD